MTTIASPYQPGGMYHKALEVMIAIRQAVDLVPRDILEPDIPSVDSLITVPTSNAARGLRRASIDMIREVVDVI